MESQDKNYNILDRSVSPIQDVVAILSDLAEGIDENYPVQATGMTIELPIELDVIKDGDEVVLGTCSRHTELDVSFAPVVNQLKITIAEEKDILNG